MDDLERLAERARQAPLSDDDYATLKAALHTLGYVAQLVEDKSVTITRLRQILFGASTEKTRDVLARAGAPTGEAPAAEADASTGHPRSAAGHGRQKADAYVGATRVDVAHPLVHHGDRCPGCAKGKVYVQRDPGVLVRLVGQAPLAATVYQLEKLRCNLCGEVYTADPPPGVGPEKYDATSTSMVALLKYGVGVPFHRLERLQAHVQIPLPASTQWDMVAETAAVLQPALDELTRQAAQGEVIHNDDTTMTVLSLAPEARALDADPEPDGVPRERTGVFTSGILSQYHGQRLALFFTGRRHAGENLARVLAERAADLGPPIQMCDALSRNPPKSLEVVLAHCLAHARRRVVDVTPSFPAECRHILETLREVYRCDEEARAAGLAPADRLAAHQARSGPLLEDLHAWLTDQIDAHRIEPNSGLGQAIAYFLKHWTPLTLFLRVPGAPLDNNVCERALKKAILHRKNALFYQTPTGAHVGDLFMSLIHTCELAGANPFDYLTVLQQHRDALAATPAAWMPWNYRDTPAAVTTAA
ncbi:MAG: IS66 family transposase [Planctomycetes bacterium]|nr:IS66 family transposase [Planctomycetota bacterium]